MSLALQRTRNRWVAVLILASAALAVVLGMSADRADAHGTLKNTRYYNSYTSLRSGYTYSIGYNQGSSGPYGLRIHSQGGWANYNYSTGPTDHLHWQITGDDCAGFPTMRVVDLNTGQTIWEGKPSNELGWTVAQGNLSYDANGRDVRVMKVTGGCSAWGTVGTNWSYDQ